MNKALPLQNQKLKYGVYYKHSNAFISNIYIIREFHTLPLGLHIKSLLF